MLLCKRTLLSALAVSSATLLSGCQSFFTPTTTSAITPFNRAITSTRPVAQHDYTLSTKQEMIGNLAIVNTIDGDTLSDIARHYGLGYTDINIANPNIAPWTPKPGSNVLLPTQFILPDTPHKGIVLNLATMRMFYYPKKQAQVVTYPVSIGREGWGTPAGITRIAVKTANPEWHVPESIHKEHAKRGDILPTVVPSGPNNPLGYYAMRLAIPRYLIHGTNKPYGIGMQVSHGCIQMYPEDIETLFSNVSVGTSVNIVHEPYLAAWNQNMLYVEAHDPADGSKNIKKKQLFTQLRTIAAKHKTKIDWDRVNLVLKRADGIPTPVLKGSPDITELANIAVHLPRPNALYGQPLVPTLKASDWSVVVDTFKDETAAQRMVAMLTHQGPSIPARKVITNNGYQVVAGPFKDKQEASHFAKRIRYEFEIDVTPVAPVMLSSNP